MAEEYIRRLIATGPELEQTFDLAEGLITIGRQADNAIHLNNPLVSRRHAQIECGPTGCLITDLGSANGTSLNDKALEPNNPVELEHGAKIQIGPFQLVFEQIAVEPAESEAEPPESELLEPEQPEPERSEPEPERSRPLTIPPTPSAEAIIPSFDYSEPPPGLSRTDSRYLQYLPGIYQTDFMARFLAIFESVLAPIEWNVDNFDMYLDPKTAPPGFLPWLAKWFSIVVDPSWSTEQQRVLLIEAHQIFARRGTSWALSRVLEIYTGHEPEIIDLEEKEDPFTFTVKVPLSEKQTDRRLIERIVDANKPAHTNYKLLFKKDGRKKREN